MASRKRRSAAICENLRALRTFTPGNFYHEEHERHEGPNWNLYALHVLHGKNASGWPLRRARGLETVKKSAHESHRSTRDTEARRFLNSKARRKDGWRLGRGGQ